MPKNYAGMEEFFKKTIAFTYAEMYKTLEKKNFFIDKDGQRPYVIEDGVTEDKSAFFQDTFKEWLENGNMLTADEIAHIATEVVLERLQDGDW